MIVLISVWPGLHVVAGERRLVLGGQLEHGGNVGGQVRRGVGERKALLDRRVGVDHARRDGVVAVLKPLLEGRHRLVDGAFLHEHLGAPHPQHHQAIAAVLGLERADVGDQLLGQVALVLALLDVRPVQPLHVALVEHGRHGLDGFQLPAHLIELRRLQYARGAGRGVAVRLEDVPPTEDDVVEARQRHELVDLRRPPLGPLPQPDRPHLGERSDRLGQVLPDGHHTGDGRGAHGAEADEQNAQLALRRGDVGWLSHNRPLYHGEIGHVSAKSQGYARSASRRDERRAAR